MNKSQLIILLLMLALVIAFMQAHFTLQAVVIQHNELLQAHSSLLKTVSEGVRMLSNNVEAMMHEVYRHREYGMPFQSY